MQALTASKFSPPGFGAFVRNNGQRFLVAIAAQFLSEHYGASAIFLGIEFTARTVLHFSVTLLGARISVELMLGLSPKLIAVVLAGVVLTIPFGLLGACLLGRGWRFSDDGDFGGSVQE